MQDTKCPALSRTWRTHNTTELDGAVISARQHTVTLSREVVGGPLNAEVDGQPANVKQAVNLLSDAWKVEVLAEVLSQPTAPATLGNARAHKLHQIMSRLGLQDHYGIARRATGNDCFSLAVLTEAEAKQVWAYLLNMFPFDARRAAA